MRHGVAVTDLGQKIFCRVIGSNVYGADTAYTNVVGPVTSLHAPYNAGGIDAPDVTGTPTEGETLHCDYGVWSGDRRSTIRYQWYQEGAVAPPGDCADRRVR